MLTSPSGIISISGEPLGLATTHTSTLIGLDAHPISVEVCCTRGPAFFQMVGLAHAAVREARVRVSGALARLGVLLDEHAITVNLAPADLRKGEAALDLSLAVALLSALGHVPAAALEGVLLLGELSLDGRLHPVRGVLPLLAGARDAGMLTAVVPKTNGAEGALAQGVQVLIAGTLGEVVEHFSGGPTLGRAQRSDATPRVTEDAPDMCEIMGQAAARRALEVAAAGGHNLLMIGPPGAGKTMLARRLPGLLPPMTFDEAVELTKIQSVSGLIDAERGLAEQRPFRAPHHTVSEAGLIGGGDIPRPGEITLAHHGVLFLDELAEFRRGALEALRQPLEDGVVTISRARGQARFPAQALVVAAVNPCPCGYAEHPTRRCRCAPKQRGAYLQRLSGPLVDRMDIHVQVAPLPVAALNRVAPGESTAAIRVRITAARDQQLARQRSGLTQRGLNGRLSAEELRCVAQPGPTGTTLLNRAVEQLGLSARAYVKILRVARTLADLEQSAEVSDDHVAEAIQARLLDREPPG